jgi:hypothetical protein
MDHSRYPTDFLTTKNNRPKMEGKRLRIHGAWHNAIEIVRISSVQTVERIWQDLTAPVKSDNLGSVSYHNKSGRPVWLTNQVAVTDEGAVKLHAQYFSDDIAQLLGMKGRDDDLG